jgi:hypothetical protein
MQEDRVMSENRKFAGSFAILLGILVLGSMGLYVLVDTLSKRGFGHIVDGGTAVQENVDMQTLPE